MNQAEKKIEKLLLDQLSDSFFYISNLEIPDRSSGRFLEIDGVLISPHAVYLIEVKDWGSLIEGDDRTWYLNGYKEKPNPHRGLNYKCRVIQSYLAEYHPQLRSVWVQGIVVIARDNVKLELDGYCKDLTFQLNSDLINYLQSPQRLRTPPNKPVTPNCIVPLQAMIQKALLGEARVRKDNQPLIIQGYQIEEELSIDERVTEYLGTKILNGVKHGTQKRLRVFRLPQGLSPEEQRVQQQKLLRDYEALEKIGSHPNIVGLKGAFDDDSGQFVEVLDWSEEGTLRAVLNQRKLSFDETVSIVQGIAKGLAAIHAQDIIHRALRPENILMTTQGPQLMNFDRAYLYMPQGHTVWQTISDPAELPYLPPELAQTMGEYDCFESSDLYSLGAIWYELLCGTLPYPDPQSLIDAGGLLPEDKWPSHIQSEIPETVDILIQHLYAAEPEQRHENAEAFLALLTKSFFQPQPLVVIMNQVPQYEPPAQGERIGDYELLQSLGVSGHFSEMFLARHYLFRNKKYALKVNKRGMDLDNLIDEFNILDQLNHPHIVKVSNGSQLADGRFFLAMEYLEGQSVRQQVESLKEQALPLNKRLDATYDLAKQMLDALRYLHEPDKKEGELKGTILLHRDIKPENIMQVPGRGYILVDFNIAKQVQPESTQTMTGTKPYIPPDLVSYDNILWEESADTFALGCTLFELLTGEHPYKYKPSLNQAPMNLSTLPGSEDLPSKFCSFLLKAVNTRSSERFKTALDMQEALTACFEPNEMNVLKSTIDSNTSEKIPESVFPGVFQPSPWIRFLRQYGPISRNTNMYDESIQRELKRTKIDPLSFSVDYLSQLVKNFSQLQPKSVILTGTAGDGKTYTSRRVWEMSGGSTQDWEKGGIIPILPLSPQLKLIFIKDLSEVDDAQAMDLVKRFALSIKGQNPIEVFLIAANDGQLMEKLSQAKDDSVVSAVFPIIEEMLVKDQQEQTHLNLIMRNLSRMVRTRDSYKEMFKILLEHDGWKSCNQCPYQNNKCPIWENRKRMDGQEDGQLFQKRLIDLLELSQLNDRHLTTRQILLLLANALLGHPEAKEKLLSCEEVPLLVEKGELHMASIYRNIFGENLSVRKRESIDVFKALNHFGIGYETNNRFDDTLIFGNDNPDFFNDYHEWVKKDRFYGEYSSFKGFQEGYIEGEIDERQGFLNLLRDQRQRLFFVLPENQAEAAKLWQLTVYHSAGDYLQLYHDLLAAKELQDKRQKPQTYPHIPIVRQLMRGLNRVITGLPTTTEDELYLATSGCFTQAKVSPVWEGAIKVGPTNNQGIVLTLDKNTLPQLAIVFQVRPTRIREDISLPVYRFEFLCRIAKGLLPGSFSNEYYKDILALKTQLLRRWKEVNQISEEDPDDLLFESSPLTTQNDLQFIDLEPEGNLRLVKVAINLPAEGQW